MAETTVAVSILTSGGLTSPYDFSGCAIRYSNPEPADFNASGALGLRRRRRGLDPLGALRPFSAPRRLADEREPFGRLLERVQSDYAIRKAR